MSIAFQGFAINNNLSEAESDRAILNNLSGPPIGDDISLLYNNDRNESTLQIEAVNIVGDRIVIPGAQSVFANKTLITVDNQIFYVKESNGQDSFRLSSTQDLTTTVSDPPEGLYVRSDRITFNNMNNFSVVRRSSDINRVDTDTQLGALRTSRASFLGSQTIKQALDSLESNLDSYNFKKSKTIRINESFLSSRRIESNGVVIITDSDNVNATGLTNETPGLFIYNAATNSGIRAFSSSDNPWEFRPATDPNNLIVSTSAFSVKELNFNLSNITLTTKGLPNAIVESVTAQVIEPNFTHKVPITVNNETYFLCLRLES